MRQYVTSVFNYINNFHKENKMHDIVSEPRRREGVNGHFIEQMIPFESMGILITISEIPAIESKERVRKGTGYKQVIQGSCLPRSLYTAQ